MNQARLGVRPGSPGRFFGPRREPRGVRCAKWVSRDKSNGQWNPRALLTAIYLQETVSDKFPFCNRRRGGSGGGSQQIDPPNLQHGRPITARNEFPFHASVMIFSKQRPEGAGRICCESIYRNGKDVFRAGVCDVRH